MNLGITLSSLKKYKESEQSYMKALTYRTKYPDCYYNLGVLVKIQFTFNKTNKIHFTYKFWWLLVYGTKALWQSYKILGNCNTTAEFPSKGLDQYGFIT